MWVYIWDLADGMEMKASKGTFGWCFMRAGIG